MRYSSCLGVRIYTYSKSEEDFPWGQIVIFERREFNLHQVNAKTSHIKYSSSE